MLDQVNWNGIRAYKRDFWYTLLLSSISISIFAGLISYLNSKTETISISIGLFGLIAAVFSIESTTVKLKEIQTDYWNTRGIEKREQKKFFDALQAHDNAIRIDKKSIKCYINKANTLSEKARHHEKTRLNEALRVIQAAIDLGPKYPATLLKGTLEEQKSLQEYANAWKTKGDILLELAKDTKYGSELCTCATKAIEEAIKRYPKGNPELPGAYASLSNAWLSLKRYSDAITACHEAIRLDPHEAIAWAIEGTLFLNLGRNEDAIKDFDKVIEIKPDFAAVWYNRGNVILDQGRTFKKQERNLEARCKYDEAIHDYEKAIEFSPSNVGSWNNRGKALFEQGKFSAALESYDRAIDINPQDSDVQRNRVDALWALALDISNKQGDHPKVAAELNSFGMDLKDLGSHKEARKCFERALEIAEKVQDKDHIILAETASNLGMVLKDMGELKEARKYFEKALEIYEKAFGLDHPSLARDINNLGLVLKAQGELQGARMCFERGLKIDEKFFGKDHPVTVRDVHNLGLVLKDMGELQEALLTLKSALEMGQKFYGPDHTLTKLIMKNIELLG